MVEPYATVGGSAAALLFHTLSNIHIYHCCRAASAVMTSPTGSCCCYTFAFGTDGVGFENDQTSPIGGCLEFVLFLWLRLFAEQVVQG